MRRILYGLSFAAIIAMAGTLTLIGTAAQDASQPIATNDHPIVGTWIVDTVVGSDTDSPEMGLFMGDGTMVGQGANRVAAGAWKAIDERSVSLTLVTVSEQDGVGAYVVVRGTHVLDESGDRWTCDNCSFTVVAADGTVLDSGNAPAGAVRLPIQTPDAVGTPLSEIPAWSPVQP